MYTVVYKLIPLEEVLLATIAIEIRKIITVTMIVEIPSGRADADVASRPFPFVRPFPKESRHFRRHPSNFHETPYSLVELEAGRELSTTSRPKCNSRGPLARSRQRRVDLRWPFVAN